MAVGRIILYDCCQGNKMIKNIIFDMGGVLVDLNGQRCIEAFDSIGASAISQYVRECRTEDLFLDIEIGRSTTEEFCNEVRRMTGCSAADADIIAAWGELLSPMDDGKKERLLALKEKGYRLFLLSNTNDMHWQRADKVLFPLGDKGTDDYFEMVFLSHEMGIRKPCREIYERVLKEAGLDAAETMFVDDNEMNVLAAAELGITPFHEKEGHRWMDELKV